MSESTPNPQDLTIQQANEDQKSEILRQAYVQWGSTLTGIEYFTRLQAMHEANEYGADGRLIYWVLVPKHNRNTTDFYACCRTFRREVLVLRPNQAQATSEVGYNVTGVLAEPKYRGKGYASRMMSLIHRTLAYHLYPDPDIQIPVGMKPATVSILYSAVGSFYARCGPNKDEPGWKTQGPISTTWGITETISILDALPTSSYDVALLSGPQVLGVLDRDVPDLSILHRSPTTAYFAFPPRLPYHYLYSRSEANPSHKRNLSTAWGAHIPSKDHFITWTFDYGNSALRISRLKADSDTLLVLLRNALRAGVTQECKTAEAWNVPQNLLETATLLGGITGEREAYLPAYRWYGVEHTGDVVWAMNEQYSFC